MNIDRSAVVSFALAALCGVIVFSGSILACAAVSGVIEPHGRIEAFLNAPPVHRHPLQLAAAAWLLHVLAGGIVGSGIGGIARMQRRSPWHLSYGFAGGYLVALVSAVAPQGFVPAVNLFSALSLLIALCAVAAVCAPKATLCRARS